MEAKQKLIKSKHKLKIRRQSSHIFRQKKNIEKLMFYFLNLSFGITETWEKPTQTI